MYLSEYLSMIFGAALPLLAGMARDAALIVGTENLLAKRNLPHGATAAAAAAARDWMRRVGVTTKAFADSTVAKTSPRRSIPPCIVKGVS